MNQLVRFACTVSINFIGYTCLNSVHWSNFIHWLSLSPFQSKNRCIESICFTMFIYVRCPLSPFSILLWLSFIVPSSLPFDRVDIVTGFLFFFCCGCCCYSFGCYKTLVFSLLFSFFLEKNVLCLIDLPSSPIGWTRLFIMHMVSFSFDFCPFATHSSRICCVPWI